MAGMKTERITLSVTHDHPSGELRFMRHVLAEAFLDCQSISLVADKWIPVSERLPPLMTEVLGWHPADRVRAWFRHSGQPKDAPYWELWTPQDRECDDCDVDEPTHWMPLPEPPEVK